MSTTKPRATKKFKALVAFLGSEEQAVNAWNRTNPDNPIGEVAPALPEGVQALIDAGFSVEEARELVATKDEAPAVVIPQTSREQVEVMIEDGGFAPVRGRVYTTPALIEAQVRVLKNGKPEIIRDSGEHRTKAVAVFRTDDGKSVALQNLGEARE